MVVEIKNICQNYSTVLLPAEYCTVLESKIQYVGTILSAFGASKYCQNLSDSQRIVKEFFWIQRKEAKVLK